MKMLAKFAVTNYRGFRERIEWDLSRPSNYTFNQGAIVSGIIKNGIIYGPNGAGKTNLSLAIFDIENHLSQKNKKADYYSNFAYAGRENEPVSFEYTFRFDGDNIEYCYAKDAKGILLSESLKVNGCEVFAKSPERLSVAEEFHIEDTMKSNIMSNANNLSIVNFLLSSFPLPQDHYLIKLRDFANSMLWFRSLRGNEYIGLESGSAAMETYIIEHNLINDFKSFLHEVSEQDFDFVAPQEGDKILYCAIDGSRIPFQTIESTGTGALKLLYYWFTHLASASFVFIDEFDAFYHFRLSFEVCKRLFAQKCQVFTSSHNTYLMTNDLLRPDCNFILQHGKIKPLSDCTEKELRFANNIEKLYRGGGFAL